MPRCVLLCIIDKFYVTWRRAKERERESERGFLHNFICIKILLTFDVVYVTSDVLSTIIIFMGVTNSIKCSQHTYIRYMKDLKRI